MLKGKIVQTALVVGATGELIAVEFSELLT